MLHQAPAFLSLNRGSCLPPSAPWHTGTLCAFSFSLANTFHMHTMLFPGCVSEHCGPSLAPFPPEINSTWTPSSFFTLLCLLALCKRSLSHLMRINHSVITISSLSFSSDETASPCSSTASFPCLSSLLAILFAQKAASNLIFTPWQTRQHALKSFPSTIFNPNPLAFWG